jgi:hypothetical protein
MKIPFISRLHRLLCAALTAVALAAQGQAPAAAPATPVPLSVADQAAQLAWWGDLQGLERLYLEVNQPGRYAEAGQVLVNDFRHHANRSFVAKEGTGDTFMVEVVALAAEWTRLRPQLPMVHWLYAQTLVNHAWEIRGGGFANTVAPQAWAEFRQTLERAVQHMARTSLVSLQDSSAFVPLVRAGRGLGWEFDRQEQLVAAGLQRNPDDVRLWQELVISVLPKWGGNAVLVDRVIRRAANQTKERADEIYARLYAVAAEEGFGHSVFVDSAADWPRMRQGLRDGLARWPAKARFWNQLAYFGCLKEDRDTLIEALEAIQNTPDLDYWGDNSRRVFESCQKLARQG